MPETAETITILTANQRLAAFISQQYDQHQQAKQLTAWPSLDCSPLNRWIIRMFDRLAPTHTLLSESQELTLWEKIIRNFITNNATDFILLRPFATAKLASDAWHLLKQWRLPLSLLANTTTADTAAFYQWADAFQAICNTQHWLDHSSCVESLITQLDSLRLPQHIVLVGFEEITPQLAELSQQLAKHCQLHWQPNANYAWELSPALKATTAVQQRIALLEPDQEILAMAHWANQLLQEHPNATIGCVVPDLNVLRNKVERIFTEVFTSADTPKTAALPFNLSAGMALTHYPLIHTALHCLQMANDDPQPLAHISYLLRSPFIGNAETELTQRTLLDIVLRQTGELQLPLTHVLILTQQHAPQTTWCTQLTAFLNSTAAIINSSHLPSAWVTHFNELLQALLWPGERSLSSAEFQQWQRWQSLLLEFATLDLVFHEPITFYAAQQQLRCLAQRTLFQPKTATVPVQILGILEAAGLHFDYLWVMGMNDEYWPQSPNPNPFIPVSVQRKYVMPHASAERELTFSSKLTARFCHSAATVIFSYSQKAGDSPLRVSTLISHLPETTAATLLPNLPIQFTPYSNWLTKSTNFETLEDHQAPQLFPADLSRGGANILKDQAACPFRAFAKNRLGAIKLPAVSSGLSSIERGVLLHAILEQLWGVLDNHSQLCSYPEYELTTLIHHTVTAVLTVKAKQRPITLKPSFLALEIKRLTNTIQKWLQLEKTRPFFRVMQRETQQQVLFAGLPLHLRLDREDELADGTRLIIDYKTGQPSIADWFGQRPNDPQLPLYSLISPHAVQGLTFAKIRSDQKPQFKGISAEDSGIPGIEPIKNLDAGWNWSDFQAGQLQALTQLATNFIQGHANVDPKDPATTCEHCDLQALCRIDY